MTAGCVDQEKESIAATNMLAQEKVDIYTRVAQRTAQASCQRGYRGCSGNCERVQRTWQRGRMDGRIRPPRFSLHKVYVYIRIYKSDLFA